MTMIEGGPAAEHAARDIDKLDPALVADVEAAFVDRPEVTLVHPARPDIATWQANANQARVKHEERCRELGETIGKVGLVIDFTARNHTQKVAGFPVTEQRVRVTTLEDGQLLERGVPPLGNFRTQPFSDELQTHLDALASGDQ